MAAAEVVHGEVVVSFDDVSTGRAGEFLKEGVRGRSHYGEGSLDVDVHEYAIPRLSGLIISDTRIGFAAAREPKVYRSGIEHWDEEARASHKWYSRVFSRKVEL